MSSAPNRNSVFTPSQATSNSFTVATEKPAEGESSKMTSALSSRFTMLKSIGAHEDFSIYLAKDRSDKSLVILRVLSSPAASDSARLKMFYLESSAAARLSHENIVKTYEAFQLDSSHFSVSEHRADTKTLRDILDQTGWLAIDQTLNIARQILYALEYAHSKGVWHLGIQPEEVLIEPDGKVRLTGFGIDSGNELIWVHKERSRLCPARYISPEQVSESDIDHRADLYTFGIVLFEMLTDRVPFESHDPGSIRQKHLSRAPEPPSIYREGIPRSLSDLVMDLLEKNPDHRIRKVSSYHSLLSRLRDAELSTSLISPEPLEETLSNPATVDFLPFGLQMDEQDVIDAEVVSEFDEREGLISEAELRDLRAPIYESTVTPSSQNISELALSNTGNREQFEPPTISAIDLPFDQNYDCTPQIEFARRKPAMVTLLPQSNPKEDAGENSMAISVTRLIPASFDRINKAVISRRALVVIAGIALLIVAFAVMLSGRSSSVQNAPPAPAQNSSSGEAAPLLPGTESAPPASQPTTDKDANAVSSPTRKSSVRASSPGRRVGRSQNRSRRYQGRKVRRLRR